MKKTMLVAGGLAAGGALSDGCSPARSYRVSSTGRDVSLAKQKKILTKKDKSVLSFVTGKDTRKAAIKSLAPLKDTVTAAIKGKQVVIKPNIGVIGPNHHHEITDVELLRGILDFLMPIYDRRIIVAEGSASQAVSMKYGLKEYGYYELEREYNHLVK